MTSKANNDAGGKDSVTPGTMAERGVRPIGAWVIAGLLLFATVAMWTLVSMIFYAYS
jgi:hypothetical protein